MERTVVLLAVVSGAFGWGCGAVEEGDPRLVEAAIADLSSAYLSVGVHQNDPRYGVDDQVKVVATLVYDDTVNTRDCFTVPGLEARIGDIALEVSQGALQPATELAPQWCKHPSTTASVEPLVRDRGLVRDGATVTMRDASRGLSVFLDDLLLARTVELIAPPTGGYRAGDVVRFRWHPASDLEPVGDRELALPSLSYETAAGEKISIGTVAGHDQGQMSFVLPATIPAGEGMFWAQLRVERKSSSLTPSEPWRFSPKLEPTGWYFARAVFRVAAQ